MNITQLRETCPSTEDEDVWERVCSPFPGCHVLSNVTWPEFTQWPAQGFKTWARLAPNGKQFLTFFFPSQDKIYLNLIWKSSGFVPFTSNLGPNPTPLHWKAGVRRAVTSRVSHSARLSPRVTPCHSSLHLYCLLRRNLHVTFVSQVTSGSVHVTCCLWGHIRWVGVGMKQMSVYWTQWQRLSSYPRLFNSGILTRYTSRGRPFSHFLLDSFCDAAIIIIITGKRGSRCNSTEFGSNRVRLVT